VPVRTGTIKPYAAGALALAAILVVVAGAFAALALIATTDISGVAQLASPYFRRVVVFTLWQAALSTLLSVAFAVPLTMALTRRQSFPGRGLLIRLFAVPLALPALVAVLGVVAVWGRTGWVNTAFDTGLNIYGLAGILIAHVFFNLPLATRLLLVHFERVPAETWRLATQLNLPPATIFRLIEWPVVRSGLPGIATLIFMLCIASFTVVLTLGGGPRATTIEVAIYQALRFDFDPARAVVLALVQIALCAVLVALAGRFATDMHTAPGLGRRIIRPDLAAVSLRIADGAIIILAALFITSPMLAVIISGLTADLTRLAADPLVWRAIATSAAIAAASAILSVAAAWSLAAAARENRRNPGASRLFASVSGIAGNLILVAPPVVLAAGWFILLHRLAATETLAPVMVITINALMALPFALRILAPAIARAHADHDRLCASLGLTGWPRFRLIDLPVLKRPLALALAFAAALSIGDLGVIALFGSQDFTTLPLLLYQRFGSYRIDDASGLALILMIFCLGLIALAERISQPNERRADR
jgi:thiamine transport system permease protein